MRIQTERIRQLNDKVNQNGPVVYWMSRDQRLHDNWAFLYAQELALSKKVPLVVFFGLAPTFLGATARHYGFMLKGLQELGPQLQSLHVSFVIRAGTVEKELVKLCTEIQAGAVVTDFSPLRLPRQWREGAAKQLHVALYEVDAHNVVPCWHASPKQEYAAYTLRPKINKLLPQFLVEFPKPVKHPFVLKQKLEAPDFEVLKRSITADASVHEVDWIVPGEKAAAKALKEFINHKLKDYDESRNDPGKRGQSDLSPYLHFGQISAQRVALDVISACEPSVAAVFLEELIVRRELADNFCAYNPHYDSVQGFPDWAKRTLAQHENDPRPYAYTRAQLEQAATHDDIWNSAQLEMVERGKMHGYLRMYWAKKILEWTPSPKDALEIAIYLNDKYELDGRDPNGYCGIAWSIGGVHDRAWFNRPVFGMIRYMSYNGCKSKFSKSGVSPTKNRNKAKR